MRYIHLADGDLHLSRLIFGCGNFGGIGSAAELFGQRDDESAAHLMLDAALERGITMFDTADTYGGGRSERWLGTWLRSRGVRDRVLVTTKVGNRTGPEPYDAGLSARRIHAQVDASLRRLGTDRIDLYLTHVRDDTTPMEETVTAFHELIVAGKIRHYGLSNVTGDEIGQADDAAVRLGIRRPVNLQAGFNLLEQQARHSLHVCAGRGISFTAFSPLAGGLLSGKYRRNRPVPDDSRLALLPSYGRLVDERLFSVLNTLDTLAAAHGVGTATLALAWVLRTPGVAGALVAPRSVAHLDSLCTAMDVELSENDLSALARPPATDAPS